MVGSGVAVPVAGAVSVVPVVSCVAGVVVESFWGAWVLPVVGVADVGVDDGVGDTPAAFFGAQKTLQNVVLELLCWPTASAALLPLIHSKAVSVPIASTNTPAATAATRPQRIFRRGVAPVVSSGSGREGDSSAAAATEGVPTAAGAVTKLAAIRFRPRSIPFR